MPGNDDLEREIIRCRDRLHYLEGLSGVVKLHGDQLNELRRDVRGLARTVSKMSQHDAIAAAVAERVNLTATRRMTTWQLWSLRVAVAGGIFSGVVQAWVVAT